MNFRIQIGSNRNIFYHRVRLGALQDPSAAVLHQLPLLVPDLEQQIIANLIWLYKEHASKDANAIFKIAEKHIKKKVSSTFLPNLSVFWHINEGIEEIMADYVHQEMTRISLLVYLRLFLLIVIKDVFLSLLSFLNKSKNLMDRTFTSDRPGGSDAEGPEKPSTDPLVDGA